MKTKASTLTSRMLSEFCEKRLAPVLPGEVVKKLHQYMVDLLAREEYPPYRGAGLDLKALAQTLSLDHGLLLAQKAQLRPVFDAIARHVAEARLRSGLPARRTRVSANAAATVSQPTPPRTKTSRPARNSTGRPPRLVMEFPVPLFTTWDEPENFGSALRLHASRHGETIYHLYDAVVRPEDGVNRSTLIVSARPSPLLLEARCHPR